jgi:CDP-glycerol glycerophosphotransferase (TagB/SpsB family)
MPWKYTPERVEVDRVVVSSDFEQENFTKNYGFRKQDLLPSGMPCLELLHRSTEKKNRILFAPSWRYYLIKQAPSGEWLPADSIFLESDYYKETQAFLNNPELIQVLEENDLYLDFKIHPIFMPYLDYFETPSDRIVIADNSVDDNAYAAFMTDFSSYVFNFAYLKCPIVYFVPDLVQFKAGLNLYRQLDLPFEKAFGELTESGDEAVNALRRIIENGMQPQREYQERMDRFFLPIEDSCEMLYHMLRN